MSLSHVNNYFREVKEIIDIIDCQSITSLISELINVRAKGGRLFFLGSGGSAANASHAVNDFRKIAGIEAYSPSDNVSELTARVNDDGWENSYSDWLGVSNLNENDALFVFSVGGGDEDLSLSPNIVQALKFAKNKKSKIFGIVGRSGGYTGKVADVCVRIPTVNPNTVTAHAESFQAVIWHLIVSHPKLKQQEMKWESLG